MNALLDENKQEEIRFLAWMREQERIIRQEARMIARAVAKRKAPRERK